MIWLVEAVVNVLAIISEEERRKERHMAILYVNKAGYIVQAYKTAFDVSQS